MDERTRILKLVESGVITAEEAISLLEKLSNEKAPHVNAENVAQHNETQTQSAEKESSSQNNENTTEADSEQKKRTTGFEDIFGKAFNNKKVDQMMNDIREDVTEFSDRVMTFMNTTLSRVKSGEMPFGEKVEFEKIYVFSGEEVKSFEIDIPNGKIDFEKSMDDQVTVKAFIKIPILKGDHDEVQSEFLQGFVEKKDTKLDIITSSKLAQIDLVISAPEKDYDVIVAKLLTGAVALEDVTAKLVKAKTYNGSIKYEGGKFDHADLQTTNGSIEVRFVEGKDLEANTANGRVYIDGKIKEVDAESVNGHVIVTTSSAEAHKVKAHTLAGTVELYIPKKVSLEGNVASNFGKVDVQLADATVRATDDQFLRKTVYFNKIVEDATLLKLSGESRTGSVIVRYTTTAQ